MNSYKAHLYFIMGYFLWLLSSWPLYLQGCVAGAAVVPN